MASGRRVGGQPSALLCFLSATAAAASAADESSLRWQRVVACTAASQHSSSCCTCSSRSTNAATGLQQAVSACPRKEWVLHPMQHGAAVCLLHVPSIILHTHMSTNTRTYIHHRLIGPLGTSACCRRIICCLGALCRNSKRSSCQPLWWCSSTS